MASTLEKSLAMANPSKVVARLLSRAGKTSRGPGVGGVSYFLILGFSWNWGQCRPVARKTSWLGIEAVWIPKTRQARGNEGLNVT
jgi:hypothetical protein